MEKVLITGGSGMIGRSLSERLAQKGFEVCWLVRKVQVAAKYKQYQWNIDTNEIDGDALKDTSYIVHLAGASVSDKKWSKTYKREIEKSRIQSTELLFKSVLANNIKLKAFIGTSAIGFYGASTSEHIYNESDPPGKDYLAGVCINWESAIKQFETLNIRTVIIRTGVVLSQTGGALKKIAETANNGLAAALGSGNQYVPWIHINDIVGIFEHALMNDNMYGVYNGVAQQHITNKEFTHAIASSMGKKVRLPNVPSFVLKLTFGEMASIILEGSRVSSEKIANASYSFEYKEINNALENLTKPKAET